jgi:hypothetical protein
VGSGTVEGRTSSGFGLPSALADLDFKFFAVEPALLPAGGAPLATEPAMALFEIAPGAGESELPLESFAATFWTLLPELFGPALEPSFARSSSAWSIVSIGMYSPNGLAARYWLGRAHRRNFH